MPRLRGAGIAVEQQENNESKITSKLCAAKWWRSESAGDAPLQGWLPPRGPVWRQRQRRLGGFPPGRTCVLARRNGGGGTSARGESIVGAPEQKF